MGITKSGKPATAANTRSAQVLTKKRDREKEHEAELTKKKAQAAECAAKAAGLHKYLAANRSAVAIAATQKGRAAAKAA